MFIQNTASNNSIDVRVELYFIRRLNRVRCKITSNSVVNINDSYSTYVDMNHLYRCTNNIIISINILFNKYIFERKSNDLLIY